MRRNAELLASVRETPCPRNGLVFWWMGQHSFIVKVGGKILYIDPYLAENPHRRTPPLLKPEEVTNADLVLCTHDHGDHIDPHAIPGIAEASPNAFFISSRVTRARMRGLGVPETRLISLSAGDAYHADGIKVTAIKARHEFFDEDPALGFPYLGFVVEANGATFYHAGDTTNYDGLATTLSNWQHDVQFLPINGRDARRYKSGILGNLTFQEAVDLAGDTEPRYAIPTHYEMFAGNSANPDDFVEYLNAKFPQIRTWVGEPGEPVAISSD